MCRRKCAALVAAAVLAAGFGMPALAADRVPNDPLYPDLWYLKQIGAPEAWNYSLGFEGLPIAIIDSGVDIDHPDLKANVWHNLKEIPNNGIDDDGNGYVDDFSGWDFVDNDNTPQPEISGSYNKLGANHGTINAGLAAAVGDNGKGVVGVTWQSAIMALRALDSDGNGTPDSIVRAVEYAVANGAKVINLSFAGQANSDLLGIALRRAYDAGVFVVVAAGNAPDNAPATDLDKDPRYPICLDQGADENFVYGVTATDENDQKAAFANYGAGCVDISAPGTHIISTQLYRPTNKDFDQPYGGYYNGTSTAAAIVAGAVALIRAYDPTLTPKQVMNLLTESAFKIDGLNPAYAGKLGRGRIDVAKAIGQLIAAKKNEQTAPLPTTASLLPGAKTGCLLAAAPGPGRAPEIRLFTQDGLFVRSVMAFSSAFRGGVSLAVGDFDGNGKQTLVAGAGAGGGPQVRIFNVNTKPIGGFFAFDQKFRGGVSVAAGDLNGDGRDEIIAGAGPGGGPHVRIFKANGSAIGGFFAFDQKFRGGVSVAAGDLNGDGRDEIVAVSGAGSTTLMRIFDAKGTLLREVQPFGRNYRSGAQAAAGDVNNDGRIEAVAVPARSGAQDDAAFAIDGSAVKPVGAYGRPVIKMSASNAAKQPLIEALAGAAGSTASVSVSRGSGPAVQFDAYEAGFKGGVRVGLITCAAGKTL